MANPSGRSFRVIDTTHLAAVAVLEAEIGAGNELVERPEMSRLRPVTTASFEQLETLYGILFHFSDSRSCRTRSGISKITLLF